MPARLAAGLVFALSALGLNAQAPGLTIRIVSPGADTYLSGPVLLKAIIEPPRRAREAERVLFYADRQTDSIRATVAEVERRRALQQTYNAEHGITPRTILKPVRDSLEALYDMDYAGVDELPARGGHVRSK